MYNLKLIKSGKRIEVYKYTNYTVKEKAELPKHVKKKNSSDEEKKDSRIQTLATARNNIVRLLKCNEDLTTFITLTFKEECDYMLSKKYLNILFTKLRRDYNNFKYLWVLEYGDINKRLHYHLLCNFPIAITLASSNEKKTDKHKQLENIFRLKYWNYGFVDIRKLNDEGNTNIALYVSSYIVKSLKDINLEGYRIYSYSRNLNKPIEVKIFSRQTIEEILKVFNEDIKYSTTYEINNKSKNAGKVIYIDMEQK